MKKIISYCLFTIFIFTLHSCKQDPGGTFYAEPEPVFSVAAKFGNNDVLIEAGRNDFYMFTSYEVDSLDVLVLKGDLNKLENCLSDCQESLAISIRDSKVWDEETSSSIDISEVKSREYGFVGSGTGGNAQTAYAVSFMDRSFSSQDGPSETIWNYSPSVLVEVFEPEFTDTFTAEVFESGITVSLTSIFGGDYNCSSSFEKTINLDYQTDCFYNVVFDIIPDGNGVNYKVVPFDPNFSDWSYVWDSSNFGDTLSINSPGTYCVTISNATGCSEERCISIANLDNNLEDIEYCVAAFSYEVEPVETPGTSDQFDFSKIVINYTDKQGIEYRSDRSDQPESSFFIIETLDTYDFNEFQEPTVKLTAKFRVVLYDELGNGVLMHDGVATIGVAIPGTK